MMQKKDSKQNLKDILTSMGMAFTDVDEIVEKSKTVVKKDEKNQVE